MIDKCKYNCPTKTMAPKKYKLMINLLLWLYWTHLFIKVSIIYTFIIYVVLNKGNLHIYMIWLFPYHIPYQPSTNIIPRASLGLIWDVIRKEPYNILYVLAYKIKFVHGTLEWQHQMSLTFKQSLQHSELLYGMYSAVRK